jgi:hypothetical protein
MTRYVVIQVGGGYAVKRAGRPYYCSDDEHNVFPTRREAEGHARRRERDEAEPAHDAELHEALLTAPALRTDHQLRVIAERGGK